MWNECDLSDEKRGHTSDSVTIDIPIELYIKSQRLLDYYCPCDLIVNYYTNYKN